MNKKYFAISVIAASVAMTACSDDDDPVAAVDPVEQLAPYTPGEGNTAMDFVANSDDHGTLQALIEEAGLAQTLDDPKSQYTIFAPTDAAFAAVDAAALADLRGNAELLARTLKGHVVANSVQSSAITDALATAGEGGSYSAETLATGNPAQSLTFSYDADAALVVADGAGNDPVLLGTNLDLNLSTEVDAPTTGIVHSIDSVFAVAPAAEVVAPTGPTGSTGATGSTGGVGGGGAPAALATLLSGQTGAEFSKFQTGIAGNETKITEDAGSSWTIFAATDAGLGASDWVLGDHVIVNAATALTPAELLGTTQTSFSGKSLVFGGTADAMTLNGFPLTLIKGGTSPVYRLDGKVE